MLSKNLMITQRKKAETDIHVGSNNRINLTTVIAIDKKISKS
jgi:hypothetical protein